LPAIPQLEAVILQRHFVACLFDRF
jgi:hypothetical protein